MIPIYEPYFTRQNKEYAIDAVESGWISSQGSYVDKASNSLKDIAKCRYVTLTNSGTSATHLLYRALKYKIPKLKNILVPSNVYVAAWNAMLFDGDDINLIPVPTDLETWNINIADLLATAKKWHDPQDTAILIVHNLGGIVNVPKIQRIIPEYQIIEDNCEGFLGEYEGHLSGTKSLGSSVSFYGNKTLTCGEGGAVLLNDEELYELTMKIRGQGQTKTRYLHDILGHNYRMTNVQAAILYGQIEDHQEIIDKKRRIFNTYRKLLDHEKIKFQKQEADCKNSNWIFAIRVVGSSGFDCISEFLLGAGIETRNMFFPMSSHKHLQKFATPDGELVDDLLRKEIVMLPSSPSLTEQELEYICTHVLNFVNKE